MKLKFFLHSFRAKVTLALVCSLLFVMAFSNLLIYKYAQDAQLGQLRERLKVIAQTATLLIDASILKEVPLNRDGINSPAYKLIAGQLNRIKAVNPILKYIYTLSRTSRPYELQFVVDPSPQMSQGSRKGPTAYPGDRYNASNFPEMLHGFNQPSADKTVLSDAWGTTLSGYAPIRDNEGGVVAILGVDMAAEDVSNMRKEILVRTILVLLLGLLVSLALGLLLSSRLTARINKLVEGTRHIAEEDLEFKVNIKGDDEISELAGSFNQMASNLAVSREKLHDYFYRAVQSLVRILEAKDAYTRGHSDRVAELAEKIGRVLGITQERLELLKKAAQLHDIGKLAIHESILNKKGKLTNEEWEAIKEHPVIGEEVLRPILLDEELLSMVRSHHERYDGSGYPDKIDRNNINFFAQIIAVADAFDAMTSQRAYRQALSQDAAIVELKTNSGTQFNPSIVQALLKALEIT